MFHGHLDMSRVAAIGHSLGGAISEGLAAADPRVTTFIGMAGATVGSFGQTAVRSHKRGSRQARNADGGHSDQVVSPAGIAKAFAAMRHPSAS